MDPKGNQGLGARKFCGSHKAKFTLFNTNAEELWLVE